MPLLSSFARGKLGTRYPCYLCQTKSCDSYGKSIKRDVLENDIGDIIKTLQPDQSVVRLLTGMFRHIWEARGAQAVSAQRQGKRQVTVLDREIDKLLDLIMASSNTTVIQKYEEKITQHELDKARLLEKLEKQAEPAGAFEEKLEPAITFLTNPWKLCETQGEIQVHLRRAVLHLAFKDRIKYCRKEGASTPEFTFPFNTLRAASGLKVLNGAPGRSNLEPFEADKVLSALEDWSEVLRADPETSRKLAAFSEAAEDTSLDRGVLPPPPEPSP